MLSAFKAIKFSFHTAVFPLLFLLKGFRKHNYVWSHIYHTLRHVDQNGKLQTCSWKRHVTWKTFWSSVILCLSFCMLWRIVSTILPTFTCRCFSFIFFIIAWICNIFCSPLLFSAVPLSEKVLQSSYMSSRTKYMLFSSQTSSTAITLTSHSIPSLQHVSRYSFHLRGNTCCGNLVSKYINWFPGC